MEAMRAFGLEFIDANVTTSLGTMLVSSAVKVSKTKPFGWDLPNSP